MIGLTVNEKDLSMVDYKSLPIGDQAPSVINAVVEVPKDSKHKYEYDPALRVFRLVFSIDAGILILI
jgi:inorganic pyrophosphatase